MKFDNWKGHESEIAEMEKKIFPEDAWSLKVIYETIAFPLFYGEVLMIDHVVVGYYGMTSIDNEGHIANIAVDIPYQQKGYGKILMDRISAIGQSEKNVTQFTLEVRVSNARAISLYEKSGFAIAGRRKEFYQDKEDSFIMWKMIDKE